MNRTPLLLSIFASIFLTVFLWNVCPSFVKAVDRLIYSYDYPIPSWILFHGVFALSFGLIPFSSYLIWRYGKFSSMLSLLVHSLFIYALAISTSAFIFVNHSKSAQLITPWMTEPNPNPFNYSWREYLMNFVIPLSVFLPLIILLVVAFINRRKITESKELDQSVEN